MAEKLFYGRCAAAEMLDVSARVIDDAIRAGKLTAFRIGRRVLIRREVLIEFAQRTADQRATLSTSLPGKPEMELSSAD